MANIETPQKPTAQIDANENSVDVQQQPKPKEKAPRYRTTIELKQLLMSEIDRLADEQKVTRSDMIRELLSSAISQKSGLKTTQKTEKNNEKIELLARTLRAKKKLSDNVNQIAKAVNYAALLNRELDPKTLRSINKQLAFLIDLSIHGSIQESTKKKFDEGVNAC